MFVLANFLGALAQALSLALTFYYWIIIVRALISWVNPDPYNPLVRFLEGATEPVLAPLRRLLPPWKTGLDLSPLLAVIIIIFLKSFLVSTLLEWAARLRM
jgi:YggT family protein